MIDVEPMEAADLLDQAPRYFASDEEQREHPRCDVCLRNNVKVLGFYLRVRWAQNAPIAGIICLCEECWRRGPAKRRVRRGRPPGKPNRVPSPRG